MPNGGVIMFFINEDHKKEFFKGMKKVPLILALAAIAALIVYKWT